jgi:hypothetical protein
MRMPVDVRTCRALVEDGECGGVDRSAPAMVTYRVALAICRRDGIWNARLPTKAEWATLATLAVGPENTEQLLLERYENACAVPNFQLPPAQQGIRGIERGFEWLEGRDQARLPCPTEWPGFTRANAAFEIRRLLHATRTVTVDGDTETAGVRCILELSQ